MRSAVGYSEKGISRSFQLCVCQWLETLTSQPSSSFFFLVSFSQWKGKNQTPRWLDEWSIVLFTTWPTQQPTHTRLLYDNRDTQKKREALEEKERKRMKRDARFLHWHRREDASTLTQLLFERRLVVSATQILAKPVKSRGLFIKCYYIQMQFQFTFLFKIQYWQAH